MVHSHKHASNNSSQLLLAKFYYNVPVKLKLQRPPHPAGQPPGTFDFLENFCANPPFLGQKAVQMPHHRSISGDQMPPPPGKLPDYCFFI